MPSVFEQIGQAGFERLVAGFYARVPQDAILGPMYPADELEEAERRLLGFLVYRFGGPPDYLHWRGHPALRMRHAPFIIDQAARDCWVELMSQALQDAELPPAAAAELQDFFAQTASFLINRHP